LLASSRISPSVFCFAKSTSLPEGGTFPIQLLPSNRPQFSEKAVKTDTARLFRPLKSPSVTAPPKWEPREELHCSKRPEALSPIHPNKKEDAIPASSSFPVILLLYIPIALQKCLYPAHGLVYVFHAGGVAGAHIALARAAECRARHHCYLLLLQQARAEFFAAKAGG